jgi:hypothetical protein
MTIGKSIGNMLGLVVFIVTLLSITQCASKTAPTPNLPKDILGISVGMSKADAQKRLEEIAQFESEDRKTGQLWRLKNNPQFNNLAVGYDRDNKIRFVTALVEKTTAKERMRFTDVGDLASAEKQITEPHYRYFWDVPAIEDKPPYRIFAYGSEPEFLTIYSLSKEIKSGEPDDDKE